MKQTTKNLFKSLAASLSFLAPLKVLAQNTGRGVDEGLNRIQGSGLFSNQGLSGSRSVTEFIGIIIEYLLIFAGIIAVLFLIVGGYWYITSAGNAEQAEKGKTAIVNAIIGIVVIVLSFVIIRVISNLVAHDAV